MSTNQNPNIYKHEPPISLYFWTLNPTTSLVMYFWWGSWYFQLQGMYASPTWDLPVILGLYSLPWIRLDCSHNFSHIFSEKTFDLMKFPAKRDHTPVLGHTVIWLQRCGAIMLIIFNRHDYQLKHDHIKTNWMYIIHTWHISYFAFLGRCWVRAPPMTAPQIGKLAIDIDLQMITRETKWVWK